MRKQKVRFKKLTLEHRNHVESFSSKLPPYSDYYFFSLWTYNTQEEIEYAVLNNNLVIKFLEYDGSGYFYSFLGTTDIEKTSLQLLSLAESKSHTPVLKLIPDHSLQQTHSSSLAITEDRDNHDYILSVAKLISMSGSKLHQKAKSLKHFIRDFPNANTTISPLTDNHKAILSILEDWQASHATNRVNPNEIQAIKRSLRYAPFFAAEVLIIWLNKKPIGFTIFEQVHQNYAVSSFQKAYDTYHGVYEYMNHQLANYLETKQVTAINIEQDLGLPGLRQAKQKYDPRFLKKYTISLQ